MATGNGALYRMRGARRIVKGEIRSGLGGRSVGPKPTERKVRAPQDTVVGNAHRPQGPGKCNRKQTARRGVRPLRVRVKRRGKSSPADWATSLARQTPPGARPNREDKGKPLAGLSGPPTTFG